MKFNIGDHVTVSKSFPNKKYWGKEAKIIETPTKSLSYYKIEFLVISPNTVKHDYFKGEHLKPVYKIEFPTKRLFKIGARVKVNETARSPRNWTLRGEILDSGKTINGLHVKHKVKLDIGRTVWFKESSLDLINPPGTSDQESSNLDEMIDKYAGLTEEEIKKKKQVEKVTEFFFKPLKPYIPFQGDI